MQHQEETGRFLLGQAEEIDPTKHTMLLRSDDGMVTIDYTETTVVRNLTNAIEPVAIRTGDNVLVRYVDRNGRKIARTFKDLGAAAPTTVEGTVVRLDKQVSPQKIVIETKSGKRRDFCLADDACIGTSRGHLDSADFDAREGEWVRINYMKENGEPTIQALQHLG